MVDKVLGEQRAQEPEDHEPEEQEEEEKEEVEGKTRLQVLKERYAHLKEEEEIKDSQIVSLQYKISDLKKMPEQIVKNKNEYKRIEKEFEEYREEVHKDNVKTSVGDLVATGYVIPAQRENTVKMGNDLSPEQFKQWVEMKKSGPLMVDFGEDAIAPVENNPESLDKAVEDEVKIILEPKIKKPKY